MEHRQVPFFTVNIKIDISCVPNYDICDDFFIDIPRFIPLLF